MRFDLDHDWQGSISTPGAKMGERAKTQLLIVLCGIWLVFGLIGHSPWKPLESESISIIKSILDNNAWLAPLSASQAHLNDPPFYYATAALTAKILSPMLSIHDAARFSSGLWMLATLILIGTTGRELWGKGFGRQTVFVFIGSLGLILSAHTITPHVSNLTGLAASFYGFSLLKRRPYRAAILIGTGLAISFLSKGLMPLLMISTTALLLGLLFKKEWPSGKLMIVMSIGFAIALSIILSWLMLMQENEPNTLYDWWQYQFSQLQFSSHHYFYLIETMFWFCWPATPLAAWGFWRYRHQLLTAARFQLICIFLFVSFFYIGLNHKANEVFALPLLIPLTLLAGGSIETIKRGAAAALNWFGLILYGIVIGLIWLGWFAMITNHPPKIKERLTFLSGLTDMNIHWFSVIIGAFVSIIWLMAIMRSQHSNRSAATNWAIGMTAMWTLLMTLWLPMIESARTYGTVFSDLKTSIKSPYQCVNSIKLGSAQRDFLHYYADIKAKPITSTDQASCDLLLIQDYKGKPKVELGNDWLMLFSGKRISERKESFRLYSKATATSH